MVSRISGWTVCIALVVMLLAAGCNRGGAPTAEPTARASASAAASVAPSPSPSPSPAAEVYVVKSGDTLSEIARRFDTTVEALVEQNDIDDPDVLDIGQELVIPSGGDGDGDG